MISSWVVFPRNVAPRTRGRCRGCVDVGESKTSSTSGKCRSSSWPLTAPDHANSRTLSSCNAVGSTRDVPFCAATTMATVVVLAGCSASELAWSGESRDRPPTSILPAIGRSHSGNRSRLSSVCGDVVAFRGCLNWGGQPTDLKYQHGCHSHRSLPCCRRGQSHRGSAGHAALLEEITEDTKGAGILHHRFVVGAAELVVIDEWETAEQFQVSSRGTLKSSASLLRLASRVLL